MEEENTKISTCQTLSLVELCHNDLKTCIEPSIFLPSEISTKISESQLHHNGNISQGIMWQPLLSRNKKHQTQIMLLSTSFKRNGISDSYLVDSSSQTCHFKHTVTQPLRYNQAKNAQEENEDEEECIISGCNFKGDIEDNSKMLYRINCQESQSFLINEALNFLMPEKLMQRQHLFICSKHFVTYPENIARKNKVSKASTNDQVQTVSNRPRRRPKPNRAYDWAEVDLPRIHSESAEQQKYYDIDEEPVCHRSTKPRGGKRKHFNSKQKKSFNKAMRREGIFFSKQDIQDFQTEVQHSEVYLKKVVGVEAVSEKMVCDTSVQCTVNDIKGNHFSTFSDGSANIHWQRLYEMLSIILEELGPENACHPRISACLNSFLKDLEDQENWQQPPTPITILKVLTYGLMSTAEKSNNIYVVSEHTDEEELEIRIQDAAQTMGGPISSVAGSSLPEKQYKMEWSQEVPGSLEKPDQIHQEAYEIHNLHNDPEPKVDSNEDTQDAIENGVYHSDKKETPNSQILRTFTNNEAIKKKRLRMSLSQKKDLCLLKEEYPTITHENLGRVFQDQWGFTVSKSTVRDILKEKDKWLAVTDKDIEAEIKYPKHKTITPWIRQKLCQYKNENPLITIDELILWAKDNLDMILDESIAPDILRFDQMWRSLISQTSESITNIQNQETTNYFEDDMNKGKVLKVSIKQKQDLCLLKEEYPSIPFEKLGKIFHDEWGFTISKTAAREIYRDKDKWLSTNPQNTWRTRSKPPSTISAEQKMALCQLHEEFPFITREEIAKIFHLEWGIDMSLSTISGILKDKAKWLQFDY